jgi:hypothetical protein
MCFSSTGKAKEQDIFGPVRKLACDQLRQLTPKPERQPLFVELVQGFAGRQVGHLLQPLDASPATSF